jgi:hypothetical protein
MLDELDPETRNSELIMLFQVITDDIKNLRRQQWTATYYILLTYAAIIGFYSLKSINTSSLAPPLLSIVALGMNLLGLWYVMDTNKNLCFYRMRLTRIKENFVEVAKEILDIRTTAQEDERYVSFRYYFIPLTLSFIALLFVGLLFVICLVFHDKWCDQYWLHWIFFILCTFCIELFFFRYLYCKFSREVDEKIEELKAKKKLLKEE